ncbi:unnamed protein product [Dicrocoelium dendriticum]|nr:unnamed protein product [Dicrocoelium dendriticum]
MRCFQMEFFFDELFDFLLLFDGPDCMSKRIAAIYDNQQTRYVTSGHQMVLLLLSDTTTPNGAFSIKYGAITDEKMNPPQPPFRKCPCFKSSSFE